MLCVKIKFKNYTCKGTLLNKAFLMYETEYFLKTQSKLNLLKYLYLLFLWSLRWLKNKALEGICRSTEEFLKLDYINQYCIIILTVF